MHNSTDKRDCSHSSACLPPKPPSMLIASLAFLNQCSQIASCMREVVKGFYISSGLFKTADLYSTERAVKGAVHGNIERGAKITTRTDGKALAKSPQ